MKLGIIGGSGIYSMEGIEKPGQVEVKTPFGQPSDAFHTGVLEGMEVIFLPRHGRGHRLLPGELNHRANIFAMKTLGVTHLVSISAVGSFRKKLRPRDVVLVDQYVDRTKHGLEHTFFGNGIVAHIGFGEPVCPQLRALALAAAKTAAATVDGDAPVPRVHDGGTYLNMEGPAFSTKAESELYRSWGMDVIGMTNLPEAKLAREAEICYTTVAMVTDYDCWHPDHDHVTVEMIIAVLNANAGLAKRIIREVARGLSGLPGGCSCGNALATAIITNPELVGPDLRRRLAPIIGKYMPVKE
jgi:5'-methylthioadenosine phosphorylase